MGNEKMSRSQELEQLVKAWRTEFYNQSEGGLRALRGFRYQYLVGLDRAVESWLAAPECDPVFAVELLSDVVVEQPDGRIQIAQAKRTGGYSSIRDALNELWSIHQLAEKVTPSLVQFLSYRVLAAFSELKNVAGSIKRFSPVGAPPESLESFRSKVEVDVTGDPLDKLLMKLATTLGMPDPLPTIKQWLGQLLETTETGGLEDFSRQLYSELATAQNAKLRPPRGIHVWSDMDCPPTKTPRGEVLTGQAPLPRHLREGFFAYRTDAYTGLFDAFNLWLHETESNPDPGYKVPVFWIAGRSGCGKSVALLHLLTQVRDNGWFPVLWLGGHLDCFPDAIQWADRLAAGATPIIALDDPYAPSIDSSARPLWSEAAARFQDLRDMGRAPFLVCAGPTEQAELLQRDLADDLLVTMHVLSHRQRSEATDELREFFRLRRGIEPRILDDGDTLLVQRIFEWHVGSSLHDFALRFKGRASVLNLADWLGTVLAANRLYVGLPSEFRDTHEAREQDALDRLLSENHLAIDKGRPGIWITHPHLANELFDSWHPISARQERTQKTLDACKAALVFGDKPADKTAVMWAIGRAIRIEEDHVLHQRVKDLDLERIARNAWSLACEQFHELPTSLLPVWIGFEIDFPNAFREQSAVLETIKRLDIASLDEVGLRLCCHRLLTHVLEMDETRRAAVYAAVDRLLARSEEWHEWCPVAIDLATRRRSNSDVERLCDWAEKNNNTHRGGLAARIALKVGAKMPQTISRLDDLVGKAGPPWVVMAEILFDHGGDGPIPPGILAWLANHHATQAASFLLGRLLKRKDCSTTVVQYGRNWLEYWAFAKNANFVLEPWWDIIGDTPEALKFARVWASPDRFAADRVYERLLAENPSDEVIAEAQYWVCQNFENRGWPFVWQSLHERSPDDTELVRLSLEWLKQTPPENASWWYVWKALRKSHPEDTEHLGLAQEWLKEAPAEHGSWAFVWTEMRKARPDDQELAGLAREWLKETPAEHGSWKHVWKPLWKTKPGDEELAGLAREWLKKVPAEHGSWQHVWEPLWKTKPGDEELAGLARKWLKEAPAEHGSWKYVWEPLWKTKPGDEELAGLARKWLKEAPAEHGSWQHVWEPLWQISPGDEELAGLAREWLKQAPAEHVSWKFVWEPLWQISPGDAELARLGLEWLKQAPAEHGSWAFVWTEMRKDHPDDAELAGLARKWLKETPAEHGSWAFVWTEMWKAHPDDTELAGLARKWLKEAPAEHGSWAFVWTEMRKDHPDDAELADLARKWLKEAPAEHVSWHYVWDPLWQISPDDAELARLGLEWLKKAPAEHDCWNFVWETLWQSNPRDAELAGLARKWLKEAPAEHASWQYVWDPLWQISPGDAELARLGLEWLKQAPAEHGSWQFVWEPLWKISPGDAELARLGLEWLKEAPAEHGSWSHVWEPLWQTNPGDAELVCLGRKWLNEAPAEHGFWKFVWEPLWQTNLGDAELVFLGRKWLNEAPAEHGSWNYVWEPLWKISPGDAELARLGLEWLKEAPAEHGSWNYAWETLWQSNPGDAELIGLGLEWLKQIPAWHIPWTFVWNKIRKANPDNAELERLGLEWLERVPAEHGSWHYVWDPLWKISPGDAELARLGLEWLKEAPAEHRSWNYAWETLWQSNSGDAELVGLGLEWLKQAPAEHRSWTFVWTKIRETNPNDSNLASLGLEWLKQAPAEHGSWHYVWDPLWQISPGDAELARLGLEWLKEAPAEHHSWTFVWTKIWETSPNDSNLASLGLEWLKQAPAEYRSWRYVWEPLWQNNPGDAELVRLSRDWLKQAPAENRSWGYVWESLWQGNPGDSELTRLGREWLQRAPDEHRGRYPVQTALYPNLRLGCRVHGTIYQATSTCLFVSLDGCDVPCKMDHNVAMALRPSSWSGLVEWDGDLEVIAADHTGSWVAPLAFRREAPIPGVRHQGLVSTIADFGLFIATRVGACQVHVSTIAGASRGDLVNRFQFGQSVNIVIDSVDEAGNIEASLEDEIDAETNAMS
jgi:hypothetical protein